MVKARIKSNQNNESPDAVQAGDWEKNAAVYQPKKISPQRHRGHGDTQRKRVSG
jgi:hypothetical protein